MQTVFLEHRMPDGTSHVDWLFELEADGAARIPTFRLMCRPDEATIREFDAERLPDHRRVYLDYEGPVSGDRGVVRRLARGRVIRAVGSAEIIEITFEIGGQTHRWRGEVDSGESGWRFRRRSLSDSP